jgi:type VI secretion system protein
MNRTKTLLRWIAAVLLAAQLAACGSLLPKGTRVAWSELTLSAAPNANQNSPVAVDVVMVLDDAMLARLAELPAAKWFGARADLQKTFPQSLSYLSWELVPGQTIRVPASAFGSPRVSAVLVFANYTTPGAHRARVEDLKGAVAARFDIQSFDVTTTR